MFTFRKVDGSAVRFLIHFYFLNEDGENIRYYGSARDVTEITNLQRHMVLLSRFTSRTILFLLYNQGVYSFEIAAHGLEKDLDISKAQLLEELNAGVFYKRLVPASDQRLWKVAKECAESKQSTSAKLKIRGNNGKLLNVIVDADYVDDEYGDVKCILSIRKK